MIGGYEFDREVFRFVRRQTEVRSRDYREFLEKILIVLKSHGAVQVELDDSPESSAVRTFLNVAAGEFFHLFWNDDQAILVDHYSTPTVFIGSKLTVKAE